MAVGSLGVFLSTMDLGMMRIALPSLGEKFGVEPNSVIWVQLITFMVGAGMTLTMGRAADMYGRKRVFSLSLLIMGVGLCLCSLSQSFGQLLASRFILSIGLALAGSFFASSSLSHSTKLLSQGVAGGSRGCRQESIYNSGYAVLSTDSSGIYGTGFYDFSSSWER